MKQDWLTIIDVADGFRNLTECDKEAEGEIVIPEGVTRLFLNAFDGCDKITSLVIPESIKSIEWTVRSDMDIPHLSFPSLAKIHFPSNSIYFDFYAVKVLKTTLWYENQPNGVVYAGVNAIGYKGEMPEKTELVIKEGTKNIACEAFRGYDNLLKVTLPNSLVEIGAYAFSDCKSLSTIYCPNVPVKLGAGVLNHTLWLDNQPEGVVYLGANLLVYKGEMPEDTEITIKEGTKSIAAYAFDRNVNLKKVTLPKSLTHIGDFAFAWCFNLVSVVTPEDDYLTDEKNKLLDDKGYIGDCAFSSCEKLEFFHFPSAVTFIGMYVFSHCDHLETVYFPMLSSFEPVYVDEYCLGIDKEIPRLVFEGRFPKTERLFANLFINELWVNDKSVLNSFPNTNRTFEGCKINELRINLARKNCKDKDIPKDIITALHSSDRGHIIYAAPELCEEVSKVPGYIRVTNAREGVYRGKGDQHDGDVFDINTKYIVSVEPVDIERYHPVKGSIIRCAANAYEGVCVYTVYEPCDMVLRKIETSLRMLSEQVGGIAGLLNQLETLVKPAPIVNKD